MRKKLIHFLLICTLSIALTLMFQQLKLFDFIENRAFDYRAKWSESHTQTHPDIILILIDDNSIKAMNTILGRWPWPRFIYSELIDFLSSTGTKAQIFDILFTESQKATSIKESNTDDLLLSESTYQAENVIHSFQLSIDKLIESSEKNNQTIYLPKIVIDKYSLSINHPKTKNTTDYFLPFNDLILASKKIGFVDVVKDSDGIIRKTDLVRSFNNNVFPSLPLAAAFDLMNLDKISFRNDNKLILNSIEVPLLPDLTYQVKMKKSFPVYSAGAILQSIQAIRQGRFEDMLISPEVFENKIVFIGASAAGTHDNHNFSLGSNLPGVYFQASILDNILLKDFYHFSPFWKNFIFGLCLSLLSAGIIFFIPNLTLQIGSLFLIISVYLGFNFLFFKYLSTVFNLIFTTSCFLLTTLNSYGYIALTEGKERRKMRRMLSKYVSPNVLSEVMDKANVALTAEVGSEEELTILFSDIRSFTSMSESTSASNIVSMLNYYLSEMVEIIFEYNGTLDKFIGDAIMAFWGAPLNSKTHAYDTVCSALDMNEKKADINKYYKENSWPKINFGIGIHTGTVILGNIGSSQHLDYTIIGDDVNLASRIEGLTKHYKCPILMSEFTYHKIKDDVLSRPIDCVQVKGKTSSIILYEPIALLKTSSENQKDIAEHTNTGFENYQLKKWKKAETAYKKVLSLLPDDHISNVIIERISYYKNHPPDNEWSGVYIFDSK